MKKLWIIEPAGVSLDTPSRTYPSLIAWTLSDQTLDFMTSFQNFFEHWNLFYLDTFLSQNYRLSVLNRTYYLQINSFFHLFIQHANRYSYIIISFIFRWRRAPEPLYEEDLQAKHLVSRQWRRNEECYKISAFSFKVSYHPRKNSWEPMELGVPRKRQHEVYQYWPNWRKTIHGESSCSIFSLNATFFLMKNHVWNYCNRLDQSNRTKSWK